jgi:hypothetical protein
MSIEKSIIICILLFFVESCGNPIKNQSKEVAAETLLKDFYTDYITLFVQSPSAENQRKLEMLQKQFCTKDFYKKIPEIIEQTGGDVFLKAQDSDIKYLKTLKIVKEDTVKDEYIVSYSADASMHETVVVKIHVTLPKDGDSFKINGIR